MDHDHDGHSHSGCCGSGDHEHGQHDVVAGPGDELVTCAVRGTTTLKSRAEASGLVRNVEGEQYYFCCGHCVELFDADPHAYTRDADMPAS